MTISRRGALIGAGAAAVVAGVPVPAIEATEPLVALEADLMEARAAQDEAWKVWQAVHHPIKDLCSGWPKVDFSSPAMDRMRGHYKAERINLGTIKEFNRCNEGFAGGDLESLARRKAEGRERIRWWIKARRAQRAAEEEAGLPRVTAVHDASMDRMFAAEKALEEAPVEGLRGALIKLREAHYQVSCHHEFPPPDEVFEVDMFAAVLRDFERLAGGMRP